MNPENTTKKPRGGIAFRSKLLPYADEITRWQHEGVGGKTYPQIAELLKTKYGVEVVPATISAFVLARVRGHKRTVLPLEEPSSVAASHLTQAVVATEAPSRSAFVPTEVPKPAAEVSMPRPPGLPKKRIGLGALPIVESKYKDENGRPVPPPPDPRAARPENL